MPSSAARQTAARCCIQSAPAAAETPAPPAPVPCGCDASAPAPGPGDRRGDRPPPPRDLACSTPASAVAARMAQHHEGLAEDIAVRLAATAARASSVQRRKRLGGSRTPRRCAGLAIIALAAQHQGPAPGQRAAGRCPRRSDSARVPASPGSARSIATSARSARAAARTKSESALTDSRDSKDQSLPKAAMDCRISSQASSGSAQRDTFTHLPFSRSL